MIPFAKLTLVFIALELLETTILSRASFFFRSIDVTLLFVAWLALRRSPLRAAAAGMIVGFFQHLLGAGDIAIGVVASGAAGWFAGEAHRRLVGESSLGLFLIVAGMVLVHDTVVLAAGLSGGLFPFAARFLLLSVPAGIITAAVGAALHEGERFIRRRARTRRASAAGGAGGTR